MLPTLSPETASGFARVALGHVTREYPNKLDHVMTGPGDVQGPRALHPVFFGSFDWHSCVHGHWLLARLYRRFPELPEAVQIRALLDAQFTEEKIAGEVAYLARPESRGFERPYGWAWALMLEGELLRHADPRWAETVRPLADAFVKRFEAFLPLATYPVRVGVHSNTAFTLLLALDYAGAADNPDFAALLKRTARTWYGADRDCQAWEPSQDEFLSPTLIEAALMRRVLSPAAFSEWFAAYLPDVAHGTPRTLFAPAAVSDRSDGKIAHLDGLNLSRAWCWRLIADGLAPADPLRTQLEETITRHVESALPHIAGDYMGEHWLASFATLALDPVST
ncbi:MAG: DUF2891 family protein [Alphaproteobacteria bacterium]|nr:DUF2891 family protein [Alphaproteobacteria bacterium]MDE2014172.1 DUF2891 domain-containing protein [Alphaproteobacteria bacterium]MDE2074557.1 DUF2891 domain-containing protein [Alphaproteobacteria bacterium]